MHNGLAMENTTSAEQVVSGVDFSGQHQPCCLIGQFHRILRRTSTRYTVHYLLPVLNLTVGISPSAIPRDFSALLWGRALQCMSQRAKWYSTHSMVYWCWSISDNPVGLFPKDMRRMNCPLPELKVLTSMRQWIYQMPQQFLEGCQVECYCGWQK